MSLITDGSVTPITAKRDTPKAKADTENGFLVTVDTAVLQRCLLAEAMVAALTQDVADRDEAIEHANEHADELKEAVDHLTTGISVQRQANIKLIQALRVTVAAILLGESEPEQWAVRALRHAGAVVPDLDEARALLHAALAGTADGLGGDGR